MDRDRINFAKLQLLRYVDELFVCLSDLLDPEIEEAMNLPSHGLTRQELTVLLHELFEQHIFVAKRDDRGLFTPSLSEIEAAFDEKNDQLWKSSNTFYGMTTAAHELYKNLKSIFNLTQDET